MILKSCATFSKVIQSLLILCFFTLNFTAASSAETNKNGAAPKREQFHFTETHRKLLRELRIAWDPTENGAVTVHPLEPFGSQNVYGDISHIVGLGPLGKDSAKLKLTPQQEERAKQFLKDLFPAVEIFLQNARLAPGEYKLRVKQPSALDEGVSQVDFVASEREKELVLMSPPEAVDGDPFTFTSEHRKLLFATADYLRGNSRAAKGEENYFDVPALDPKRPYGDMTYYPLDIAEQLGIAIDNRDYEGRDKPPPFRIEKLKKLVDLHLSMLDAMILFLAEATLEVGNYEKRDGVW